MHLDLCGWIPIPSEVNRICTLLPQPIFNTPDPDTSKEMLLYPIYNRISGKPVGLDVQGIGDCTSFGWKHLFEINLCVEIDQSLRQIASQHGLDSQEFKTAEEDAFFEYQDISSEAIYAIERVNVGGQRGSYRDGGVGAWCAKMATDYGTISRPNLKQLGLQPDYDPRRAKDWGARGVPDVVLQACRPHIFATVSQVRSFNEAAWHIQNGRAVAVCSNVGFENGPGRTTQRDQDGFASPRGTWPHCMCFIGVRFGSRPGLLILNQWPKGYLNGPTYKDQPENTWWVDAEVCDQMLGQGDSFTGDKYKGYPAKQLDWRF